MISIVSVNFNDLDFIKLQIETVKRYTTEEYEHIIIDNSTIDFPELRETEGIVYVKSTSNLGHGEGLNVGVRKAQGGEVLVLDSDAHIMAEGWEKELRELKGEDDLLAARGGALKPIRPCVMFFEKRIVKQFDLDFAPQPCKSIHIDAGVYNYFKILHDGGKVAYLDTGEKIYKDVWGEFYYIGGKPYFYHNWYGSRFWNQDEVDGRKKEDQLNAKKALFNQVNI